MDAICLLVIDDSPTYREYLRLTLVDAGYRIEVAANGEEGLQIARQLEPDGIIVDGKMPGLDGYEVIQRVRANPLLPNSRTLLLTGSDSKEDELRALMAGADAFISKSAGLEVIVGRIKVLFRPDTIHQARAAVSPLKEVLIVDDSATYRSALASQLREDGYEVTEAENGEEALEILSRVKIDCVIVDLIMPGMSGSDVCRSIRTDPDIAFSPIMVLTGHESSEAQLDVFESGADDFLSKDGGYPLVLARLQALLRRRNLEETHRRFTRSMHDMELAAVRERQARLAAETRAQTADELATKNAELEALSEALLQAKDMAERAQQHAEQANAAKSAFLASMSHEIRTPLNGILGMLDLLAGGELSGDHREMVRVGLGAGRVLLTIINDILDLSKIEAGQIDLDNHAFALRDTLRDVLQLFALRAQDKGLELWIHYPGELLERFVGDPVRLGQILSNLIGNAIKFTSSGHVLVEATQDVESHTLKLSVTDTGIGIAPDKLGDIFDKFKQADPSINTNYGGTGLGLAISKSLAQLMAGTLIVESEVGSGSTFTLTLPLESLGDNHLALEGPTETLTEVDALLLEVSEVGKRILSEIIVGRGGRCYVVPSIQAAIATLSEGEYSPSVIIVDAVSDEPDQSEGWAGWVDALRGLAPSVTSLVKIGGKQSAAKANGFNAWLAKPVWPGSFADLLVGQSSGESSQSFVGRAVSTVRLEDESLRVVSSARVLVVDDNETNLRVAELMLERMGCSVVCVDNGPAAITEAQEHGYDIVFLDCHMPGMDGYQVASKLREMEFTSYLPIVALTADVTEAARKRATDCGMDGHIPKPIDRHDLDRMLTRWAPDQSHHTYDVSSASAVVGHAATSTLSGTPKEDVLDVKRLNTLKLLADAKDQGAFGEMVVAFLAKCEVLVNSIADPTTWEDVDTVTAAAHSLNGNAATYGATALSRCAVHIEHGWGGMTSPERGAGVAALELALKSTEAEISDLRSTTD